MDVGELTYKRWRTDIRRWRNDFIHWRTGRWRTDTLAKRPVFDVKDLKVLAMDQRSSRGESVAVASLFGVVCAVTRRTIKSSEVSCYKRLIDAINELKIDLGRA